MEMLASKIGELEKDVSDYDEHTNDKKQTKTFLLRSSRRLKEIVTVVNGLQAESHLLNEIPEGFLRDIDGKIQTTRRLLQLKKVNPDQMSILTHSAGRSELGDEAESLVGSVNELGHQKVEETYQQVDLENTVIREAKMRRIQSKFEYVNMICTDLNQLVSQQAECLQTLEGNYTSGLVNANRAKDQLQYLHERQEKSSRTMHVLLLLLMIAAVGTVFWCKTSMSSFFQVASKPSHPN